MRRLWRRAIGPFKEFGLAAGALYVLDRLLRALSPHLGLYVYELIEQPIDGRPLLPGGLAKNLEFIEIGRGHPAIESMPARTDIKASRFAQGARCLGAYRKGVLLGYIWWCARQYEEDEVRCTFRLEPAASSVFDFDLYVLPEHRMGIAFMAIWHGANQLFHSIGVRHSFSRVTIFNLPSRRAPCRARAVLAPVGHRMHGGHRVALPWPDLAHRAPARAEAGAWRRVVVSAVASARADTASTHPEQSFLFRCTPCKA
jgi:hypothetical protein